MRRWLWAVAALSLAGCKSGPDAQERRGAEIDYDLGVNFLQNGQVQDAYKSFKSAEAKDPNFPEPHFGMGTLLQFSFKKLDEAEQEYKKAIELRKGDYTEAKVSLGTVHLEQGRYDEAIALFNEALNDMAYKTPFFAEGNLGWALYKKGQTPQAIDHLKSAITTNPHFCLGYKDLGIIYQEQGQLDRACEQFEDFHEKCPQAAEGAFRLAVCAAKKGDLAAEKKALEDCVKAKDDPVQVDECRTTLEGLSGRKG